MRLGRETARSGRSARGGPQGRYGVLLVTLIVSYLLSAMTSSRSGAATHVAFVAIVALLALRGTRLRRRTAALIAAAMVAAAAAAGAAELAGGPTARGVVGIYNGALLLLTVVIIVGRVIRLDRVTVQSIYAALSAYLLIGLMFAAFYSAIDFLGPGNFFAHDQTASAQSIQYFSFTTLTTLGYGDFTAADSFGRALAVLEALTGQIFLVTLVARLVSAFGTPSRRDRRDHPPGELPP